MGDCGANRAAMGNDDDVAAKKALGEAVDGAGGARHQVGEALAARRRTAGGIGPEGDIGGGIVILHRRPGQSLPGAEMLLGEVGLDDRLRRRAAAGFDYRCAQRRHRLRGAGEWGDDPVARRPAAAGQGSETPPRPRHHRRRPAVHKCDRALPEPAHDAPTTNGWWRRSSLIGGGDRGENGDFGEHLCGTEDIAGLAADRPLGDETRRGRRGRGRRRGRSSPPRSRRSGARLRGRSARPAQFASAPVFPPWRRGRSVLPAEASASGPVEPPATRWLRQSAPAPRCSARTGHSERGRANDHREDEGKRAEAAKSAVVHDRQPLLRRCVRLPIRRRSRRDHPRAGHH